MKNKILIITVLGTLTVFAISCQKKSFSAMDSLNNGQSSNPSAPSDPSCVATPVQLVTPTTTASGEVFNLSFNRSQVSWTLSIDGGSPLTFTGTPVSTSISTVGTVTGHVVGVDNCGMMSEQEFAFQVTLATDPTPTPNPTPTPIPDPTPYPTPDPTPTPTPTPTPITQDFTVEGSGMADILFVVNDFSSMFTTLRTDIPIRFAHFVPKMDGIDYHIAVTSAQATGSKDYQSGRVTKILYQPVPFAGLSLVPAQYKITPDMKHPGQDFLATILRPEAICVQVAGPCPNPASFYQEAIHSSILTLSNSDSVAKFIRPQAPLNIVIISENDEGVGNLTDRHGKIKASTPSYNRPQTLIDLVQTKWPGKPFRAHAVITKPDEMFCNNADQYNARAGFLYNELAKKTGGTVASICDNYNSKSIDKIAASLVTAPVSFVLQCEPKNLTAMYSPQPSQPTRVVVNGNNVSFSPALPVKTKVHLSYSCF